MLVLLNLYNRNLFLLFSKHTFSGIMAELNLSVCIMPAKHSVSVSVHMNDTIADMKTKLSVTVDMCIQK